MEANCGDSCIDELPACLLASCGLIFLSLDRGCMECAQANVGRPLEDIEATCTTGSTKYSYGGAFGTGILSQHPIEETEELLLDSTTSRRSVLHAVVDAPLGDVDVYCTHLTAVFALIPYPKPTGSWEEEQAGQIADMLDFIDETAETERVVLMGDMNTGPETDDARPEQLANWTELAASGMDTPFIDLDGSCTFCPENAISSVDSDATGKLIDHVMEEGFEGEATAARVLDEEITIESCGEAIPGAHSDHYGVLVTVTKK
jgi:endonuclease/exonuclease/phosphatase family metal-dependent hydrolase